MIRTDKRDFGIGESIEKRSEIVISDDYDVVVAGGGVAGFAAAVAAGRLGARVLLVERKSFVGGNAAMGLQVLGTHTITGRRATAGIPAEFLSRLKKLGAASDAVLDARVCSLVTVEPAWVKVLAGRMLKDAGVMVLLHSGITDVFCDQGATHVPERSVRNQVVGVLVNGTKGVRARVVVDTSGDGAIAAFAGAPFDLGTENDGWLQPMTLIFRMGGVDVTKGRRALLDSGRQIVNDAFLESIGVDKSNYAPWGSEYFNANGFREQVEEAIHVGDLPPDFPQQRVIWSNLMTPNEAMVLMAKVIGMDGSQIEDLSHAEARALEMVPVLVAFLRKYIPGFEHAHLIDAAPQIGIRETRRIKGEYILNEEDILESRRFPDSIGLGAYYLDIHPPKGGDKTLESMRYPLEPFEMPYCCLVPLEIDGVLIAGRCSSATAGAFGATRVIPSCMVQGQAAGSAAALSVQLDVAPRNVPIDILQELLRDQGVFLRSEETDTSLVF